MTVTHDSYRDRGRTVTQDSFTNSLLPPADKVAQYLDNYYTNQCDDDKIRLASLLGDSNPMFPSDVTTNPSSPPFLASSALLPSCTSTGSDVELEEEEDDSSEEEDPDPYLVIDIQSLLAAPGVIG